MMQYMLEDEVTEFLGRLKSARRSDADSDSGYRNGYAPARKLTLLSGTIRVRRPRVRDTEERFESRLLPLFVKRTNKVSELIPELYLHGLSEGDFDLALRGLLGGEAPLSASTVGRLKDRWNAELAEWRDRRLAELECQAGGLCTTGVSLDSDYVRLTDRGQSQRPVWYQLMRIIL